MRLLITGATGFIGSELCRRLDLNGNEIVCLSRKFEASFEHNFHHCKFQLFECDITNWNDLSDKLKTVGCVDCVFHVFL